MTAARPPAKSPRSGEAGGQRLPRGARIRSGQEIRAVMNQGKRKRTRELDVFFSASPESFPRFGLVVPKYGHNSVERNRVKRRLREIGRRELLPRLRAAGMPLDVLVRARRASYETGFGVLRETLVSWVEAETCATS